MLLNKGSTFEWKGLERGNEVDCNFLPVLRLANANSCQCWSLVNALLGHYTSLLVIKAAKGGNTRCAYNIIAIMEFHQWEKISVNSIRNQYHGMLTIVWSDKNNSNTSRKAHGLDLTNYNHNSTAECLDCNADHVLTASEHLIWESSWNTMQMGRWRTLTTS